MIQKLLTWILLVAFFTSGCVQKKATGKSKKNIENSMLWKISGNGLTAPSYLFGTMHAVCGEDFYISEKLKTALHNTEAIYFEVDMEQMKNPALIMKYMKSDKPLTDGLTPQEIHVLDSLLLKNNIKLEQVKNLSPAIIISLLTQAQIKNCKNGYKQWESELNNYFDSKKKRGAFETIDEQMNILTSIYDNKTLIEHLKSSNNSLFSTMSQIYRQEKLASLDSLMNANTNEMDSRKMDLFLYNRNKSWAGQIPEIIKTQPTIFAVGAGHLAGAKGVIQLLKNKGYSVTAVLN
ncbi:MAG: TraB/GumN family protein [Chitinophagaceae bacterium]|nr:MAG: TraB/GumN family protein [Chitinophagaceae bacterium]